MSEHVCKICGKDIHTTPGGYTGALYLKHLEPGAVVPHGVDICTPCIAGIIMQTLTSNPFGSGSVNARHQLMDMCWLCGRTDDLDGFIRLDNYRDVKICTHCKQSMKSEARRQAGVPLDWEEHPRRCSTCLHERGEACHYSPPVVSHDCDGIHSLQPLVHDDADGCDSCWRPKVKGPTP
jgi:hypothetical protein